jgi:hypothetical protein
MAGSGSIPARRKKKTRKMKDVNKSGNPVIWVIW